MGCAENGRRAAVFIGSPELLVPAAAVSCGSPERSWLANGHCPLARALTFWLPGTIFASVIGTAAIPPAPPLTGLYVDVLLSGERSP